MKTVTRVLLYLGAALFWLVVMVFANAWYLNIDDEIVVGIALFLALPTTFVVARLLRT